MKDLKNSNKTKKIKRRLGVGGEGGKKGPINAFSKKLGLKCHLQIYIYIYIYITKI